jgi:hypothetical protein
VPLESLNYVPLCLLPYDGLVYIAFCDKDKALLFEKYLNSHSGKAFANKRL